MNALILGETCVDRFVYCSVTRLCPEAPVPVLNPIGKSKTSAGMAGNTQANLLSLARIGDKVVRPSLLYPPDEEPVKVRYVDSASGYIVIRIDSNDKFQRVRNLDKLPEYLKNEAIDAIVISDYHKGFLTESDIQMITDFAEEAGAKTFLDTKKQLGSWSRNVDFVKINEKEWKLLTHAASCRNLIVTLGSRGSFWRGFTPVPAYHLKEGFPVKVFDVSGAGDTYLAAFVIEYMYTKDVLESMEYANKAAAVAVSMPGVVAVTREQVYKLTEECTI